MRNKIIAATLAVSTALVLAGPAEANEKKPKKQKQQQTVTLSAEQFQMILQMLTERTTPVTAQQGEKGPTGATGTTGPKGDTGTAGAAGKAGENGKDGANGVDGAPGRDGVDGKDGAGFSQGTIFLVNGACPAGTTIQGPQNRWTVYANDTSGRPWTTTGSSAQLFLSACMVD